MRMQDLRPRFLKRGTNAEGQEISRYVQSIIDADGIAFLCPKCYAANGGPAGTHQIICWRHGVPLDVDPAPGRWSFSGTSADDLTLVASVAVGSGCAAHFLVQNGAIVGC